MNFAWQKVAISAAGGLLAAGMVLNASLAKDSAGDAPDEGTVIQVGPEAALGKDPLPGELNPRREMFRGQLRPWLLPGNPDDLARQRRPASPYYIGVAAEKVDAALRSHVDLPDGVGLVVQMVFDGSPADEAGLKPYDILLAADGKELHELDDLINVVEEHSGDQMTEFTIDVIRHNHPQTVSVTPAERPRPDEVAQPEIDPTLPQLDGAERQMFDRLRQMPQGGQLRMFGGPGFDLNQMPGNVSVQIERSGDGPARITVQRGEEKWEIEGDDPESLKELPQDLQPMVEGMLKAGPNGAQQFQFRSQMPEDMHQRMEQMEQQMRQLQEQLLERAQENDGK